MSYLKDERNSILHKLEDIYMLSFLDLGKKERERRAIAKKKFYIEGSKKASCIPKGNNATWVPCTYRRRELKNIVYWYIYTLEGDEFIWMQRPAYVKDNSTKCYFASERFNNLHVTYNEYNSYNTRAKGRCRTEGVYNHEKWDTNNHYNADLKVSENERTFYFYKQNSNLFNVPGKNVIRTFTFSMEPYSGKGFSWIKHDYSQKKLEDMCSTGMLMNIANGRGYGFWRYGLQGKIMGGEMSLSEYNYIKDWFASNCIDGW